VERVTGKAATLLDSWPPADSQGDPVVRLSRMRGRALVLGSTQDATVVDQRRAASAAVDIVRRSTGGGAVWVDVDAQVWLDFWLPRRHDLWDDDIIGAAGWVGDTWVRALASLGVKTPHVHRGPLVRTPWSDLVCFAGLGPGEITVVPSSGGLPAPGPERSTAKVMGLAQRRTRAGARFHTTAPLSWDPRPLIDLLTVELDTVAPVVHEDGAAADGEGDELPLTAIAVGLRAVVPGWQGQGTDDDLVSVVEEALLSALP